MLKELNIASIDDLEPALVAALQDIDDPIAFSSAADSIDIVIRLKGDTWDGSVDVRVAKFVCELQSAFDRYRRNCGVEVTDRPLVKIKVKQGSTQLEADVLQFLTNLTTKMTSGQHLAIALSIIGCIFVGWSMTKVLAHLAEAQKRRLEAGKSTEVIETLRDAIVRIDPDRAPRQLIAAMKPEDTIQMPADSEPMSRDVVKDRYPRKRRVTPSDLKIDDNYLISAILLDAPPRLTLCRGDLEFKADLSMHIATTDKDSFLTKIRAALDVSAPIRAALHVDARVGDRIHSATIVGIGNPPREGAISIEEALE